MWHEMGCQGMSGRGGHQRTTPARGGAAWSRLCTRRRMNTEWSEQARYSRCRPSNPNDISFTEEVEIFCESQGRNGRPSSSWQFNSMSAGCVLSGSSRFLRWVLVVRVDQSPLNSGKMSLQVGFHFLHRFNMLPVGGVRRSALNGFMIQSPLSLWVYAVYYVYSSNWCHKYLLLWSFVLAIFIALNHMCGYLRTTELGFDKNRCGIWVLLFVALYCRHVLRFVKHFWWQTCINVFLWPQALNKMKMFDSSYNKTCFKSFPLSPVLLTKTYPS